ncbi:MAG TPA: hypothetical protein VFY84_00735, partial [Jiangellales bacterium]|nr:hypothetical protein [Jiangellales bacterium]
MLLLATIATAAAVVIPSYTRAAQQTVLTDTLTAGPAISSGITASTKNRGGVPEIDQVSGAGVNRTLGEMHQIMSEALAVEPTLRDGIEPGIGAVTFGNTVVSPSVAPVQADLVYREQVCQHVRITVGACVQGAGQIMVSARTAQRIGWRVG